MTLHQPNRLTVTCNHCSAVNDMVVLDVADQQEVTCSRCGSRLGRLGELKNEGTADLSAAKQLQSGESISSQ